MDTGADHEWVDWLRGLLKTGADALGAQPVGDPVVGLRGRTVGCRVTTGVGDRWLRVVTAPASWACGPAWTGNVDAAGITGVRHPEVLDTAEWGEHDRRARAELMTLAPGRAIATDMALRDRVDLDDAWWTDLRASLDTLAAHPAPRPSWPPPRSSCGSSSTATTPILPHRYTGTPVSSWTPTSDHADQPHPGGGVRRHGPCNPPG